MKLEPKPENIQNVNYFSRQVLGKKGFAFMWVYKPKCPECGEARLKKPKKRAKKYKCDSCGEEFTKEKYEELLEYNLEYTCPECGFEGGKHGNWDKPASKNSKIMLKFRCPECDNLIKVYRLKKKGK